jgi:hypothetical protein
MFKASLQRVNHNKINVRFTYDDYVMQGVQNITGSRIFDPLQDMWTIEGEGVFEKMLAILSDNGATIEFVKTEVEFPNKKGEFRGKTKIF